MNPYPTPEANYGLWAEPNMVTCPCKAHKKQMLNSWGDRSGMNQKYFRRWAFHDIHIEVAFH